MIVYIERRFNRHLTKPLSCQKFNYDQYTKYQYANDTIDFKVSL